MIINTSISGGAKGFRRYTYTNPAEVSGTNSYITVVEGDAELARIREFATLVVLYHLPGDSGCTKSGIHCNTAQYLPYHGASPTVFGGVRRIYENGNNSLNSASNYHIYDETDLNIGSGRVHITPDGDLRIYGNTAGFPIQAGEVLAEVIWEEDA